MHRTRTLVVGVALLAVACAGISAAPSPAGAVAGAPLDPPGVVAAQSDASVPPPGFQLISWGTWMRPVAVPWIAVEPCGPHHPASPEFACYVVQPGDWLWKVARSAVPQVPGHCALADPHEVALRANWIHLVNLDVLGSNPHRLVPGMVLRVSAGGGFLLGEVAPCVR